MKVIVNSKGIFGDRSKEFHYKLQDLLNEMYPDEVNRIDYFDKQITTMKEEICLMLKKEGYNYNEDCVCTSCELINLFLSTMKTLHTTNP